MMKNYKKFTNIFLITILIFILFHCYVWFIGNNKKLLDPPKGYVVGDLARISYCPKCATTRVLKAYTIPHKVKHFRGKIEQTDVLTFGDSFSGGAGGGINSSYQDYIALYNDFSITNIPNNHNPVETLIKFIRTGKIDKFKPKYVILQSVERIVPSRLNKNFVFSPIEIKPSNKKKKHSKKQKTETPKTKFINTGNYKFVIYNFLYQFNQRAFMATAHRMKSNTKINGQDFILVHRRDIKALREINLKNIQKINENLNKINSLLKAKGIKFYFMITPDKYDLYYDFFTEPYGENKLFELMRAQKKEYTFIDTKEILDKEIEKGNYDVYHFDDTHWSHKASEAVFKQVKF